MSNVRSVCTDQTELGRIHLSRYSDAQAQMVFKLMRLQDPRVDFILNEFSATIITGPRVALEYGPHAPQVKVQELVACKTALAKAYAKAERALRKHNVKPGKDGNFIAIAHPKFKLKKIKKPK